MCCSEKGCCSELRAVSFLTAARKAGPSIRWSDCKLHEGRNSVCVCKPSLCLSWEWKISEVVSMQYNHLAESVVFLLIIQDWESQIESLSECSSFDSKHALWWLPSLLVCGAGSLNNLSGYWQQFKGCLPKADSGNGFCHHPLFEMGMTSMVLWGFEVRAEQSFPGSDLSISIIWGPAWPPEWTQLLNSVASFPPLWRSTLPLT